ncbi:MAG: hypothetical protein WAV41_05290 [Microgenomates group bacterium]
MNKLADIKLCVDNGVPSKEGIPEYFPGMYSASGTLLIESPQVPVIQRFVEMDERITYFHLREPKVVKTDGSDDPKIEFFEANDPISVYPVTDMDLSIGFDMINRVGAPTNIIQDCTSNPLVRYLHEKYDGKNIAVRGVACSLSGYPVVINDELITNPAQILQLGAEKAVDHSPQIGFTRDDERIPYRSEQWLYQHPQAIRGMAVKEGKTAESHSIFPLLIIYNRDKFNPTDTKLPDDPDKRSDVVLEVIVLDYPLSREEFNLSRVKE